MSTPGAFIRVNTVCVNSGENPKPHHPGNLNTAKVASVVWPVPCLNRVIFIDACVYKVPCSNPCHVDLFPISPLLPFSLLVDPQCQ